MQKYRVNEACQVTGLSRKTIYRKMEKGLLAYSVDNGKRYIYSEDLATLTQPCQVKTVSGNNANNECVGLRDEVTQLHHKMDALTAVIESMTQKFDTLNIVAEINKSDTEDTCNTKTLSGDNAKRSEEAKQRLFTALDAMKEIPMYRGKPSITGIHKATRVDRGTVSKYLDEWYESTKS